MADQSTKNFLFSKEGRPVLIGTIIVMIIFPLIGYWSYQSLYGGNEMRQKPSTEKMRRAAGQTDIQAADTQDIAPDLTSQSLTAEQRGALDQYNRQASDAGQMGQPTPDDVILINVEDSENPDGLPVGEEGRQIVGYDQNGNPVFQDEATGRTIIGYNSDGKPIFGNPNNSGREIIGYTDNGDPIYADPSVRPANLSPQERRERERANQSRMDSIVSVHEEYRSRRFQAAVELVNFEGTPPS